MKGKYSEVLDGKRVFVTGGTGSFGHQVVNELLRHDPKEITVFSRDEDKQHRMRLEYKKDHEKGRLKFVLGDVRDYQRVKEVTRHVDIMFHAAALKHVPYCEFHPQEAVKTNVLGAHNIKLAAIENNIPKVVAISTDKAVKPVNVMGMTKALQEKIFLTNKGRDENTVFSCVRYGNVIGSRGSVIPLFEKQVSDGIPLTITHPEMTRFMLTLEQAIDLVFYALKNGKGGEIFVKKAPTCKIIDFARVFAESLTGKQNYPIDIIGIRPGEKIHEILVSSEEMMRAKETSDHFIINPYDEFFDKKSAEKGTSSEYSSNSGNKMSKEELLKKLKETKWLK